MKKFKWLKVKIKKIKGLKINFLKNLGTKKIVCPFYIIKWL